MYNLYILHNRPPLFSLLYSSFSNPDPFLHASLFFPIGTISPTCSMLRVIKVKILLNIMSYETLLLLSVRSKYFLGPCLYFLSLVYISSALVILSHPPFIFPRLLLIFPQPLFIFPRPFFKFPRPFFIFPRQVFSWDWMHEWHTKFPAHIKKYKPVCFSFEFLIVNWKFVDWILRCFSGS